MSGRERSSTSALPWWLLEEVPSSRGVIQEPPGEKKLPFHRLVKKYVYFKQCHPVVLRCEKFPVVPGCERFPGPEVRMFVPSVDAHGQRRNQRCGDDLTGPVGVIGSGPGGGDVSAASAGSQQAGRFVPGPMLYRLTEIGPEVSLE